MASNTQIEGRWVPRALDLPAKSLRALAQEKKLKRYLCVCLEPRARMAEGVEILPFAEFLDALWDGRYS
jgi:hypothetical protein